MFFEEYFYLSSVNNELVKHFEELAKQLENRKLVVDVGSNDGVLLRPLKKLGVRAIGVDPSENVGALANAEGLETLISFFEQDTAHQIAEKYGKPDCIVASSVFTHMEDPSAFLRLAGDPFQMTDSSSSKSNILLKSSRQYRLNGSTLIGHIISRLAQS